MQRLPNPPLVPSSMSAGGEWHSSDLAMTAPGSAGIAPLPAGLDEQLPLPVNSGPEVPVSTESGRDGHGRWTQSGPWVQPGGFAEGASDGHWRQT